MTLLDKLRLLSYQRVVVLVLVVWALASCNLASAPIIDTTGTWSGSGTATNGVTQPIVFNLTETKTEGDASVSGTMTVADIPLRVTGKRRENRLALTYTDASSVVLVAALIEGNNMSGDLNIIVPGPNDVEVKFTVTKQ